MKKYILLLIFIPLIGLGQIEAITEYSITTISNGKNVNERDNNFYAIKIVWQDSRKSGWVSMSKNSTDAYKGHTKWSFDVYARQLNNDGNLEYWCNEGGQYYSFTIDNNSSKQKIIERKIVNKRIVKQTTHYIR